MVVLLSCCHPTGAALILAYLNEKNRPYSAQDVFCNLQKQHGFGKTVRLPKDDDGDVCVFILQHMFDCLFVILQAVVKTMDLLALEGKIKMKTYGKQKIYFADQVSPK